MTARFDAIVIGLGGMGSMVLYHLARRGLRVLGLEQFGIAHDRGSSHGATRLIRRAYFEHPDYVPLVERAFTLWGELERESGRRLFVRTGLFLAGVADSSTIAGVRSAASAYRLDIEELDAERARRRFAGFHFDPTMTVFFEPDAGCLFVEECVRCGVEAAVARGAQSRTGCLVESWDADAAGVTVRTRDATFAASRLIVCAGPWSWRLLADLGLPLEVRRKPIFWFSCPDARYSLERACPVFCFDVDRRFFYGFPSMDGQSLKVGEHTGGAVVSDADQLDRTVDSADVTPIAAFLRRCAPGVGRDILRESVCMYTMTPDQHFIVDRHPRYPNVLLAAGFSGHGFKFASVVGAAIADLAVDGKTDHPIAFLRTSRSGLGGW